MPVIRIRRFIKIFVFFVFTLAIAETQALELDATKVQWSKLQFSTAILFFKLKADIGFDILDSRLAEKQLLATEQYQALVPKGEKTLMMTMTTSLLGRNSQVNFWLEPDLTALQRTQTDTGKKQRIKTYRFLKDGVHSYQKKPFDNEKKLPPQQWTDVGEHHYSHPKEFENTIISDNAALFYLVSAANLNAKGDEVVAYSFGKKHLNRIRLIVEGTEEIDVEYKERRAGKNRSVEETVQALRISIDPQPAETNVTENEFEFLGLKDDIIIYVDPKTHIPFRISGRIDYYGGIDIDLSEVILKK
ncbi:hypothetical protein [Kaarinaea lacus]